MNISSMKFRKLVLTSILLTGVSSVVQAQETAENSAAPSGATQAEPPAAAETAPNQSDAAHDDFLDSLIQGSSEQSAPAPEAATAAASAETAAAPEAAASAETPVSPETPASAEAPVSAPAAQESTAELDVITLAAKPKEAPKTVEARRPSQLEEIVVTATKRAEPLREIPATISVLSGEKLEREGIQNIEQIVSQVPGVNLTDEGSGGTPKRITIRGISAGFGTNLTAGTLIGDIPFTDPFAPKVQLDPNPFDIATVEVLKGPQGTLFGGTGLNGMIRYVPEAPQLDEFGLKYYTQLTSYPGNGDSGWNYGAMINAPFAGNTSALRLVGFHRDSPGYVDDTLNNKRDVNSGTQYGLRGILAWEPSERWKISLMGATQHTEDKDLAYSDYKDGTLSRTSSARPSPSKTQYTLANLTVQRSFDWGDLISQSSYVDKKFEIFLDASRISAGVTDMPPPILAGANDNHSKSIIQEIRAVSAPSDGPWKWLAGAFYYNNELYDCAEASAIQGLPPLTIPPILNGIIANPCPGNVDKIGDMLDIAQLIGELNLEERALFGEVTRELGDDWSLTLGARAYRLSVKGTVSFAGAIYALQNNLMAGQHVADSSERGISPKGSIAWQPSDDLKFYFTASRGFRFGGPQLAASTPTTTVPTAYKSDSLWNYELGMRSDWLDRTLRIDASVYYVDWKNPQVFQMSPAQPIAIGFIDNVGGAKSKGIEVSLTYLPGFVEGLSLDGSVSLGETKTSKAFTAASGTVVPAGSPWPLAPRWQTTTSIAYARPIASWNSGISLRHSFIGQACNSIDCTAQVFGYRTMDLNLFATPEQGSYWPQFSVTLSNLTDERGFSNITTNPSPARDTINYIAPRSLVLRMSGSF
ncbi:MAG: TonB-dependent receptor [Pseudomonadota bacterium]